MINKDSLTDQNNHGWEQFYIWDNTERTHAFLYPGMIEKKIGLRQLVILQRIFVYHADIECHKLLHHPDREHHIDHFSLPSTRWDDYPITTTSHWSDTGEFFIRTPTVEMHPIMVHDKQAINGSIQETQKKLQWLEDNRKNKTCLIHIACIAHMLGEEMSPLVQSIKKVKKSGNAYLYDSETFRAPGTTDLSYMQSLFLKYMPQKKRTATKTTKCSINIVGIPEGSFRKELQELLQANQIQVASYILPDFKEELVSKYWKARGQVIIEQMAYKSIIEQVFLPLPIKTLTVQPPYGFLGTGTFLSTIIGTFKAKGACHYPAGYNDLAGKWKSLQDEASSYCLGFVLNEYDVITLTSQENFPISIPILGFLKEMGFSFNIMIHAPKNNYERLCTMLHKSLKIPHRIQFSVYSGTGSLSALAERVQAIYSDIHMDSRIIDAGCNTFSLSAFEPGIKGAVRSIERVLSACRTPYAKKYKPYLAGTPEAISAATL